MVPVEEAPAALAAKDNEARISQLRLMLAKKEMEVRRATEEAALVRELQTVDQLALRKMESGADANRKNRLQISEESIAAIVALRDKIKIQSQRTKDLKTESTLVQTHLKDVATATTKARDTYEAATHNTGYRPDGGGGKPYENQDNLLLKHQKRLAELEKEQAGLKERTTRLTATIEKLTGELEERKKVEDELRQAAIDYDTVCKQHEAKLDDLKGFQRISYKKDKLLKAADEKDTLKELKKREGEKRVLHTDLQKHAELIRINDKAILANDDRLRKLEAKLDVNNAFLATVFAEDDADGVHRPPELAPDATHVPIEDFLDLCNELASQRATLRERDRQLEELDARVEGFEKKIDIVQVAQVSKTAIAAQEFHEMERERAQLAEHVDQIDREFDVEKARLVERREKLEATPPRARAAA